MVNLNSSWDFWYHSTNDTDWSINSYKKIATISTIEQFWSVFDLFTATHIQNGMFFIMRENIFPTWEDPDNRLGGCISYKILSENILDAWNKLFLHLICEKITENKDLLSEINGISIAPKKEFNIIKIWVRNDNKYKEILNDINPYFKIENSIYRKHELEY